MIRKNQELLHLLQNHSGYTFHSIDENIDKEEGPDFHDKFKKHF